MTAKQQASNGAVSDYTGRFKIETTTNNSTWTARYTTGDVSSYTYTIPANIIAVRCSLYKQGGTTTLLDQQTLPIVSDGAKGDTGVGISSVTELYYGSDSSTAPAKPTAHVTTSNIVTYNEWNLQCPTWTSTYQYYYTCQEILYDDGTYSWSDVAMNNGYSGANSNANAAQASADAAQSTANGRMKADMSNKVSSITIDSGTITFNSNSLVVNSSKFTLDASGNATFSGTLRAASGSFNGIIESRNAWGSTVYSYVKINNGIIEIRDTQLSGGSAYVNSMSGSAVYSGQGSVQGLNIQAPGEVCIGGSNIKSDVYVVPDAKFARSLTVAGTKSRLVDTSNYENRLLYCYETPTPYFGDIGTGCTDENGETVIGIDDIFDETINASVEYCVFLQKESQGDIWVDEKEHCYFVVKGTPNTKFSWELKAVQKDYEYLRLDDETIERFDYSEEEDVGLSMEDDLAALDSEELFDEELLLEVSV